MMSEMRNIEPGRLSEHSTEEQSILKIGAALH